jgi:signal transduction histidine kinase
LPSFLTLADNPLVRGVARVPATVNRKLLVAFLAIVVLLVTVGVLGLRVLGEANGRVETLGKLQQRTAAYQKLQTDAAQLYLLVGLQVDVRGVFPKADTSPSAVYSIIESTLANQLGPDIAHLGFVPPAEERGVMSQIQHDYDGFSGVITNIVAAINTRKASEATPVQSSQLGILAGDLELLTQQLVATTKGDTNDLITINTSAYADSQHLFIGVAAGSVVVALLLGFLISRSLVGPIRKMDARLEAIALGDFSGHVDVPNRDELGALATNLNRMSDQLGRLYGELETASRHKSEFLANMSHELRTPLNAVIGFSEVLQDRLFGDLNDKQAEYVVDIHASGRHLLALINDILDLSKIEAGRMDLQITPFALADVVQNSVALSRERATREGIALGAAIDPDIGVIEADERMLKQVLFNLLSNALKFTPNGGHVGVSAHSDGDEVVVSVHDDGVGIASADQARIFDEFQQVGTSHLQEGTGLGLAISRRFIELHGGTLVVESEPGHGSTFTFTLPRTQGTAIARDREAPPRAEVVAAAAPTTAPVA